MTTIQQPPQQSSTEPSQQDDAWRGYAEEGNDELSRATTLRLKEQSRKLLGELLRPYRKLIWLLIVIVVVENAARLSVPYLVHLGIDKGIPPILAGEGSKTLVTIVLVVLGSALIQAGARQIFLMRSGRLGQTILLGLRRRVFDHFQRLSPSFHDKYTSGRVISRLTSDVDVIDEMLETGFDGLVTAMLTLFGTAILLLTLDVKLGLLALVSFPVLFLLTAWFRRRSAVVYRRTREAVVLVIVHFVESMTGIRAVQAFRREQRNEEIFGRLNGNYAAASLRSSRVLAVYAPGITLVGNVATGVVLCYGGLRVIDGDIKVGVLATFLLYLGRFFDPLQDLSQFYNSFQSAAASLEKISGVLDEPPAVPEPAHPVPLPPRHSPGMEPPGGPGLEPPPRGIPDARAGGREVRFEAVRFGYRATPVLPGLDLAIPAGQTVALVGATGAGKTTVARLLARFYDPDQGSVRLDGVDLRDLPDQVLRREVVLVTQENFVFSGSVADNIRLGRPDATQAEVEAAARAIGADAFICALPGGYQADVGKRGGRLSAGQRQLVAFARAFLAAPAVLVLDEATSLLDIPSEQLVQAALRTILAGRTAMIIAHRLSTVEIADRVLVLSAGRVVEDGPPGLLLASDGEYSALHTDWLDSLA